MSLDFTADQSTLSNVDPDLCRHMASLGHNGLIPVKDVPVVRLLISGAWRVNVRIFFNKCEYKVLFHIGLWL